MMNPLNKYGLILAALLIATPAAKAAESVEAEAARIEAQMIEEAKKEAAKVRTRMIKEARTKAKSAKAAKTAGGAGQEQSKKVEKNQKEYSFNNIGYVGGRIAGNTGGATLAIPGSFAFEVGSYFLTQYDHIARGRVGGLLNMGAQTFKHSRFKDGRTLFYLAGAFVGIEFGKIFYVDLGVGGANSKLTIPSEGGGITKATFGEFEGISLFRAGFNFKVHEPSGTDKSTRIGFHVTRAINFGSPSRSIIMGGITIGSVF